MAGQARASGFTLLEMSIVLGIIALIAAGSMTTFTSYMQTSQFNATVAQMDAIEQALKDYSVAFGRLPCPSSLTTLANDTLGNYGAEAANPGTCTGGSPAANFSASGVAEGGIPTRALRLPDSYMYDAWGRRLRYAVNVSMTSSSAFSTTPVNCTPLSGGISVYDATGAARTTAAVYAIISHGANGHGAYTSSGVVVNAGSTNTNEQINCHCDNTAASQGYPYSPVGVSPIITAPTYVEMLPSASSASLANSYDDIVTFKENWELITPQSTIASSSNCPTTPVNIYIADTSNQRIREVTGSTGIITTVAGWGSKATKFFNGDGGQATAAALNQPSSVTLDSSGNLYIADTNDYTVRKVTASTGIITTVAGKHWTRGSSGDGGPATAATLFAPSGVALDSSGNIYIADEGSERTRKVTASTGIISTVAGNGTSGYSGDGGQGTAAELNYPTGVAVDSSGNLYISDLFNNRIRKVTAATGIITTFAGNGTAGYSGDGGQATAAELNYPTGVAVDSSGNLYIGANNDFAIRKVTASTGVITTVAGNGTAGYSGDGGQATAAELSSPYGVASDSNGNIYIADANNNVRRVIASTGIITTVAGNGTGGYSGDGGQATAAELNQPWGVAIVSR